MKDTILAILLSAAILAGLIAFTVFVSSFSRNDYKQTCADSGGKTVYNGRHLECIK